MASQGAAGRKNRLKNISEDLNSLNEKGYPALWYAVMENDRDEIDFLLKSGANINVRNSKGQNVIFTLFEKFLDIESNLPDWYYPIYGSFDPANLPFNVNNNNNNNNNGNGNGNARINRLERRREELHQEQQEEKEEFVELLRYLVSKGLKVDLPDGQGDAALQAALLEGRPDRIQALLYLGANPNVEDYEGRVPLVFFLQNYNPYTDNQILHSLLHHGADPNHQDEDGYTPFMMALRIYTESDDGDSILEVLEHMVQRGAKLFLENRDGLSPAQIIQDIPELRELPWMQQALSWQKRGPLVALRRRLLYNNNSNNNQGGGLRRSKPRKTRQKQRHIKQKRRSHTRKN